MRRIIIATVVILGTLLSSAATAEVVNVGPDGDYTEIGQAFVDVRDLPGSHEIRIQAGTHQAYLYLTLMSGGDVTFTGGWNASFTSRSHDPADTVLAGPSWELGYAMTISDGIVDSTLRFEDLTFTRSDGQGVTVAPTGSSVVEFHSCVFSGSTFDVTRDTSGVGLRAAVGGAVQLLVSGCTFAGNSLVTTATDPSGGAGAFIEAFDAARVTIQHSRFTGNTVEMTGGGVCSGAGLEVEVEDTAQATLEDLLVAENSSLGCTTVYGEGVRLTLAYPAGTTSAITARRLRVWDNTAPAAAVDAAQLWADAWETSTLILSDSVIAGGDFDGLQAHAHDTAELRGTGLTITGNAGIGIVGTGNGTATTSMYNTVMWANAADIVTVGEADTAALLSGVDPDFVDAAGHVFVPQSPTGVEDAGSPTPPEGLAAVDLAGCPRVAGSAPDAGAYEVGSIFGDGLESAVPAAWSAVVY